MEGEIDLKRYLRVFLRRKWIFIGVFLGILVLTGIMTYFAPKIFVASSRILIKRTSTLLGESQILEEAFGIDTNCEILRSRGFMEKVVDYMKEKEIKMGLLNIPNASSVLLGIVTATPLKDTDIIEIRAQVSTAEEAACIANSVAETFEKYCVEIARAKIKETRKFIETQLPETEKRLQEAEEALQRFKEKERLVSITAGGSALQGQLVNLQAEYSSIISQIKVEEKLLARLEEELKEESEKLAEAIVKVDNPSLSNLRSQLVTLENRYSSYVLAGLSEEHPKLIELSEKIEEIKRKLKLTVGNRSESELLLIEPLTYVQELSRKILNSRTALFSLRSRKEALEERIEEHKGRIRSFPKKEYQLSGLQRVYEFNENIYKRFVDHYEESKLAEVGEIGNVVIIEHANPPLVPVSPKPLRNMMFALIFGLGLGIGAVLVWEHLDTSIKDAEDVERLKIPVIGTIPMHTEGLVMDLTSPAAEAYKKLRINLKFSKSRESIPKTLLVSSCIAKEGKSTLTANLSMTYARAGAKTIIVEGDLRRPSLHKSFRISSKLGVSNLLIGEAKMEDVLVSTQTENLWIIPAGHIPPNPGELIDSNSMKSLISELRESFDMVIVDSPPLVTCADGLLLGNMVDGVILTVELGRTQSDALLQMVSSFKATGAGFLGVIVNKVKEGMYYKYRYYYKYYTPKAA
jgi:capsular exopolysaccharide synthesis family protein